MTLAPPKQEEVMTNTPLAIFSCRQNSHPFQERHIYVAVDQVKVGRSVARARPAPNNAIFDCKVLSRNHAVLWYESNKFFLQDTKSSNGTYVNSQRLSKVSEDENADGEGKAIYSGDIIQFGVDVMENSRRVTHGCIVADITLFHADGTEVKPPTDANGPASGTMVHLQELYQLSQYIQEAIHRESIVEAKLATVEQLVQSTQDSSEKGWKALIDEDRLLSKLEVLESQLQACSKNQSEDSLQEQLVRLHDHKVEYEVTAKKSLCKVVEEKLIAVQKVDGLEDSLSNALEECAHMKDACEDGHAQMTDLSLQLDSKLVEIRDLQMKLEEAEGELAQQKDSLDVEKKQHEEKVRELLEVRVDLDMSLERLKSEYKNSQEQVTQLKDRLSSATDKPKAADVDEEAKVGGTEEEEVECTEKEKNDVDDDHTERDKKDEKDVDDNEKDSIDDDDDDGNEKDDIDEDDDDDDDLPIVNDTDVSSTDGPVRVTGSVEPPSLVSLSTAACNDAGVSSTTALTTNGDLDITDPVGSHSDGENTDVAALQEQLSEAECLAESQRTQIKSLQDQLDQSQMEIVSYVAKVAALEERGKQSEVGLEERRKQSEVGLEEAMEKACAELRAELSAAGKRLEEAKAQNLTLTDELKEKASESKRTEASLSEANSQLEERDREIKHLQEELTTARQEVETEQLISSKLKAQSEQISVSFANRVSSAPPTDSTDSSNPSTNSSLDEECQSLRAECTKLKARLNEVEPELSELKTAHTRLRGESDVCGKEGEELREKCAKLQRSIEELTAQNDRSAQSSTNQEDTGDDTAEQLREAQEEITVLRRKCSEYSQELVEMNTDIENLSKQYVLLADKSRMVSICSLAPVLALLVGLVMAFYPTLSGLTATADPTL